MVVPKREEEPVAEQPQVQVVSNEQLLHMKLDEILSYLRPKE